MTTFHYTVIDKSGRKIQGTKTAINKNEIIDSLLNQGMTIISIQEDFLMDIKKILQFEVGGFSISERVIIAKELATMITAGIPIIQAIEILRQQAEKDSLKNVLTEVYKRIEAGSALSAAFRQEKRIFSDVQLSLIEAGEKSGNLNSMLLKVADDMEKNKQLRGKILGALIYPAIIFIVLIIVIAVMLVFMVPQVKELYLSFGQEELPFTTNILISLGDGIRNPLFLLFTVIIILSLTISYRLYVSKSEGRYVMDKIKLKIPIFGNLIGKIQVSEFCRVTSMLLNSGIPIIQAIDIVANSLSNSVFAKILLESKQEIIKGSSMSIGIAKNNYKGAYPLILLKMISIGEESGKLDKVLEDMYKFYDAEVEQITSNLTKLLEPIILVVVGVFVAFLAIAIYLPIYEVGNFI